MSYLRTSSVVPIVINDLRKAVYWPNGFMTRQCTPMSHQQEILRKKSIKTWMSVYIFRYFVLLMLSHI